MERARLLELALRQKGWTRAQLAEKTGYDSKTIRNLLSGQDVRPQTGYDICQALGVQPINVHQPEDNIAVSSEIFGGYLRSTHAEYEGSYYLYRPSFTLNGQVFRSIITIYWDIDSNKLSFKEYYRYDDGSTSEIDAHSGNLYISTLTGLTHFLIIDRGSIRLMTMTKLRQSDKTMRGILMTQSEDFNFFIPTVTPIGTAFGEKLRSRKHCE